MIGRYISHVPAKYFKMVRYYGFLSNRKRGKLLPRVYEALQMEARKKPEKPGFAALMKGLYAGTPENFVTRDQALPRWPPDRSYDRCSGRYNDR